jgi:hypothetical protein
MTVTKITGLTFRRKRNVFCNGSARFDFLPSAYSVKINDSLNSHLYDIESSCSICEVCYRLYVALLHVLKGTVSASRGLHLDCISPHPHSVCTEERRPLQGNTSPQERQGSSLCNTPRLQTRHHRDITRKVRWATGQPL